MELNEKTTGVYTTPVDAACLMFMAWNTLLQLQDPCDSAIDFQREMIAELLDLLASEEFELNVRSMSGIAEIALENNWTTPECLRAELHGVLSALLDNMEVRHDA